MTSTPLELRQHDPCNTWVQDKVSLYVSKAE